MTAAATKTLAAERVAADAMAFHASLDVRYVKQYHEVNVPFDPDAGDVVERFHAEHDRLYGYHLRDQRTPVEVINLRLRAVGRTPKPSFPKTPRRGPDASTARKGSRHAWVAERAAFAAVPVYDGEALAHGMRLCGPALVDQANTTLLLSAAYDLVCDAHGSYFGYRRDCADALPKSVAELVR